MKKLIAIIAILTLVTPVFATESDPSETVGFVKYSCITTSGTNLNFIALPMDAGYTMASELGDAIGCCDAISKWDASGQGYEQASNTPMGWMGDFEIETNQAYMISITSDVDVYIAGDLPAEPTYNLVTTSGTNLNSIMLPLSSDFSMASTLGDDIGVSDAISKWDASGQGYEQASNTPMGWMGDFEISIGQPLMVSVTGNVTWPSSDGEKIIKPISSDKGLNKSQKTKFKAIRR